MDAGLTASASAVQQAKVNNQVATSIATKTLDAQKQQGEAAVDLVKQVEQISNQIASGKLDIRV